VIVGGCCDSHYHVAGLWNIVANIFPSGRFQNFPSSSKNVFGDYFPKKVMDDRCDALLHLKTFEWSYLLHITRTLDIRKSYGKNVFPDHVSTEQMMIQSL